LKKILIFPHTSLSIEYLNSLKESCNYEILGFIDNNKEGENIYKLETMPKEYDQEIHTEPNEVILISSLGHERDIEDFLSKKSIDSYFKFQI